MELLQLRYFLESADNDNFSKTAEKYGVPPSGVSIAVKKLERELGCELFARENNRIRLNDRGRVLRQALRHALDEIDAAVAAVTDVPEEAGEISLLVRSERRIVGEHLLAFKQQYPQVVFNLTHEFTARDADKYDIIIDALAERYTGFERFPILSEKMLFVAARNNPLCSRRLTIGELYDQPFATMSEGSSLHEQLMTVCRGAGFRPHIIMESDDPYYLRKYIEEGLGIALIPEKSWAGELGERVTFLDVVDLKRDRVTYACFNKSRPRSSTAAKFYRFLTERETLV